MSALKSPLFNICNHDNQLSVLVSSVISILLAPEPFRAPAGYYSDNCLKTVQTQVERDAVTYISVPSASSLLDY